MANEIKMTNSKALAFVMENYEIPADVREKLTNLKTSIDKKSASKSSKPTARQNENAELALKIYEQIKGLKPMTISEIIKVVPEISGLSTQRVRPMLTSNSSLFSNEMVKGKSLYKAIV